MRFERGAESKARNVAACTTSRLEIVVERRAFDRAGGAPNGRDAEDAEPRLTARPRSRRHNRMIASANAGFPPSGTSLVMGTAHGTPLSLKAVPLYIENRRASGSQRARVRIIRLCRVPFPRRAVRPRLRPPRPAVSAHRQPDRSARRQHGQRAARNGTN